MCAKLSRGLHGTRAAPARWEALYTNTLQGLGFIRGRPAPVASFAPVGISGASCAGTISPSPVMTRT
eukprot:690344-Alexandrium_andersonii.AAC.1